MAGLRGFLVGASLDCRSLSVPNSFLTLGSMGLFVVLGADRRADAMLPDAIGPRHIQFVPVGLWRIAFLGIGIAADQVQHVD